MESWDDDETNTKDGDEDLSVEALQLPRNIAKNFMQDDHQSYEEHFPPIQQLNNSRNWGPVQATRMSARVAGDTRTILQKAQQLKCT